MKKFDVLFSSGNIKTVDAEELRNLGGRGLITDKCFVRVSGKDTWHNPNKVKGLYVVKTGPSEVTLRREEFANAHSDVYVAKNIGIILVACLVCIVIALPFMTVTTSENTTVAKTEDPPIWRKPRETIIKQDKPIEVVVVPEPKAPKPEPVKTMTREDHFANAAQRWFSSKFTKFEVVSSQVNMGEDGLLKWYCRYRANDLFGDLVVNDAIISEEQVQFPGRNNALINKYAQDEAEFQRRKAESDRQHEQLQNAIERAEIEQQRIQQWIDNKTKMWNSY